MLAETNGKARPGRKLAQVLQAVVELVVAGAQQVDAQAVEQFQHRFAGRVVLVDDRVAGEIVAGAEVEDLGAAFSLGVEDGRHLGEIVDLAVDIVEMEDDDARLGRRRRRAEAQEAAGQAGQQQGQEQRIEAMRASVAARFMSGTPFRVNALDEECRAPSASSPSRPISWPWPSQTFLLPFCTCVQVIWNTCAGHL